MQETQETFDDPDFEVFQETKGKTPTSPYETDDTELAQISRGILEIINCFFRLTLPIHNPAPHERLKHKSPIPVSSMLPFDIQHVSKKFPLATNDVIQRLGLANARRRQYFLYRETLHQSLACGLDEPISGDKGKSTVTPSIFLDLKELIISSSDKPIVDEDQHSETSSALTPDGPTLSVGGFQMPAIPAGAESGRFRCPCCFMLMTTTNVKAWR